MIKLTNKEIDKLWAKYEIENPDQGGLDTWDRLLCEAQLKKVWLSWTETPHRILETKKGRYGLDCDDVRVFWEELLKEVGE